MFSIFFALMVHLSFPGANVQQEEARAIVKKAEDRVKGTTSEATMTITVVRPKWTKEMKLKTWTKGTQYSMILIQSPAKDAGTVFLKRQKEIWNWAPTIERVIKLPPSMMSQSWMGTDFTNDDLVEESSTVEDYNHKLLGEETQGGKVCHKIELTPKPNSAVVWGKMILWIDKKDYIQMRAEMYDEDGELVNTLVASDIKTLGGRLLPAKMEMFPAGKKDQKTVMTYQSLHFDGPISDNFFTTQNMKKVQ